MTQFCGSKPQSNKFKINVEHDNISANVLVTERENHAAINNINMQATKMSCKSDNPQKELTEINQIPTHEEPKDVSKKQKKSFYISDLIDRKIHIKSELTHRRVSTKKTLTSL